MMVMVLVSWKICNAREAFCAKSEVTYDGRSLIIDGHRKILFAGSIHYPRSTPQVCVMSLLSSSYYACLRFFISDSYKFLFSRYTSNLFCIHVCSLQAHFLHLNLSNRNRSRTCIRSHTLWIFVSEQCFLLIDYYMIY